MDTIKENEVLLKDRQEWLHFRHPYRILVAEQMADVVPALQEIEGRIARDGLYAAGFLSYEAAPAFDPALPSLPMAGFPYLWFGLYPQPQTVKFPEPKHTKEILNWQPTVSREHYNSAIEQIKEHIAQGRTYQVNYTMRLQAEFQINAWDFFLHLAQSQNNHAAYVDAGRYVICSASPELFFQLDGEVITCRPMKGTVKRGRTTSEDQAQAGWLRASQKNRAENVMIVDMVRNDLGRIAEIGSVRVPELFHTERYPTLWQMTSTVTARTRKPLAEIFGALFPCASITGAPQVSTMKIINQLETTPRRIYTGSIGYISPRRIARFNVAIRTALIDRETESAEYGVGGGIVWDSTSPDEYQEALLKSRVLTESQPDFSLLETMLWAPEHGFFLREKHIERLLDSANYFDIPILRKVVEEHLDQVTNEYRTLQRVRLLLNRNGHITTETAAHQQMEKMINIRLAAEPVDSGDVFLFHKTTQRDVYNTARARFTDCDDVLLYNERDQLTEFTIGNLVVELDGELVTPPVECGLLAGTFRRHLVETGQVVEGVVPVYRLKDCTRIFRVNSIRQWEPARLVTVNPFP